MKIGILGSGKIGSGLAKQWSEKHDVMLGARDQAKAEEKLAKLNLNALVGSLAEAAKFAEVLVLAVPFSAVTEVQAAVGSIDAKILIDATNPIAWSADGPALAVGEGSSGAEEIAKLFPTCQVVKAFNSIFSEVIHKGPVFGTESASVFFCADDHEAKITVADLAKDIGFNPIDIGPLKMARYLESFTLILIRLQRQPGMSSDMGYTILNR